MPTKTTLREREQELTPDQVAHRLQVSRDQVIGWCKRGWLEATPLPRGYRIKRPALDRFLAEKPWEA